MHTLCVTSPFSLSDKHVWEVGFANLNAMKVVLLFPEVSLCDVRLVFNNLHFLPQVAVYWLNTSLALPVVYENVYLNNVVRVVQHFVNGSSDVHIVLRLQTLKTSTWCQVWLKHKHLAAQLYRLFLYFSLFVLVLCFISLLFLALDVLNSLGFHFLEAQMTVWNLDSNRICVCSHYNFFWILSFIWHNIFRHIEH